MKGLIGMEARDWDERYADRPLVWSEGPNRWVADEIAGLPPGTALDLACGEGRNALWLAGRGWQVTAVDFSRVALEKGAATAAAQTDSVGVVEWVCADLLTMAYEPDAYDLVLLAYLQLPAAGRRIVVQGAAAALAVGGTLLVVGHDSTNLTEGTGGPREPTVLYTADDVVEDLGGRPGLVVERAERVDRPVESPDGVLIAKDVLVRVHRRA